MIVFEEVASLLVDLNCPFVHKSQSTSNVVAWIEGLQESEDREKFLDWALDVVGGPQSSGEAGLVALGILTNPEEAKAMVNGKIKGTRADQIWNSLFSLLRTSSKLERSRNELLTELGKCDDFTDCVAEQVSLSDQLHKPISMLDYQMEREVNKLNSTNHPSRHLLNSIYRKVEEEKKNLELTINLKKEERNLSDTSSEVPCVATGVERFTVGSRKLTDCAEEFEGLYNSKLKPVLKGKSSYTPVHTKEVATMAEETKALKLFLEGSETAVKHINSIRNLGNQNHTQNFSILTPYHD